MKRMLTAAVLFVLLCGLCSCGNANKQNTEGSIMRDTSVETGVKPGKSEKPTQNPSDEGKILLTDSYKVPLQDIVIDVPDYFPIEDGYSKLYLLDPDLCIAITACFNEKANSLQEAHDLAFRKYIDGMQNIATIDELVIHNEKEMEVNGIPLYHFEGKLKCHGHSGNYELYTIGYSFIMDGIPCSVEGIVQNREQPQEMIDEIRNTVNAMIQTLRSKK